MNFIGSRSRHNLKYRARITPILGTERVGKYLDFLECVWRRIVESGVSKDSVELLAIEEKEVLIAARPPPLQRR